MIEAIILILSAVGFSGLGYAVWAVNRTLKAQAKTIGAQTAHLSSFDDLLKAMKATLDSVDEPAMLKRLRAYKEFVDLEKEAALARQRAELEDSHKESRAAEQHSVAELVGRITAQTFETAGRLLPYVPPVDRALVIDGLGVEDWAKAALRRIAEAAPDHSSGLRRLLLPTTGSLQQVSNLARFASISDFAPGPLDEPDSPPR